MHFSSCFHRLCENKKGNNLQSGSRELTALRKEGEISLLCNEPSIFLPVPGDRWLIEGGKPHEYSLTLQPGTGVYIWKYLHTDICLGNTEGALLESIK